MSNIKKGLVLEGGAMRGMFTAGVTDVMLENGIAYDGMIGVSAGACFGCNYKSGQIGRTLRYNKRFSRDPRYCSLRSLLRTGDLYNADFCYHRIPLELDPFDNAAFCQNPMEFYVVATDVHTGKPLYHRCTTGLGEDLEWIRASASMPLVSRIVRAGGHELLDGGMADSIPLRKFQQLGYERNVVVLTQPRDFVKGKNKALGLMRIKLRRYPALLHTIAHRHEDYNQALAYIRAEEAAGRAFVIAPDAKLNLHRVEHDPDRLQAAYDHGRAVMQRQLDALRAFLG